MTDFPSPFRVVIYDDDELYLRADKPFQRMLTAYGWVERDDQPSFRLFRMHESRPDHPVFEVVGATSDPQLLIGKVLQSKRDPMSGQMLRLRADVVLYDLHLAGLHMPQDHSTLDQLATLAADVAVVVHTNSMAGATLPEIGRAGLVRARVSKGDVTDEFVEAVIAAARGESGRDHLASDLAESLRLVDFVIDQLVAVREEHERPEYAAWLKYMLACFSAHMGPAGIVERGQELVPGWFWEQRETKADRSAAISERKRQMITKAMAWSEQQGRGWDRETATQNLFAAGRGLPLS